MGEPTYGQLRDRVAQQDHDLSRAVETLARVAHMIDTKGWNKAAGNAHGATGLDLGTLKKASENLRAWIVAGGMMKRIADLQGFIAYGDGVGFKNLGRAKRAFQSDHNARRLFSAEALAEVTRAHGSDGTVVFLVNTSTGDLIRVPFEQLADPWVDSDDTERIWYVRRSYTRKTLANPTGETVERYYVTDEAPAVAQGRDSLPDANGKTIPVDKDHVAIVWAVNRQTGWPLGVPDLLATLQWVEEHTSYLKGQARFAEALAMIAWQFKSKTPDQARRMDANVSTGSPNAGAAFMSEGQEATAMKGNSDVSFENGRPLAAQAAAAANMAVADVLGESTDAAASSLDPLVKRWALTRRELAASFFRRVARVLGAPKLEVVWPDLEAESPFREAQMIVAAWGTGMFDPNELRVPLATRLRIPIADGSTAPKDVLIPNTKGALEAAADAKPEPTEPGGVNGQGKDALGVGKTSDGDNTARDKGENPA